MHSYDIYYSPSLIWEILGPLIRGLRGQIKPYKSNVFTFFLHNRRRKNDKSEFVVMMFGKRFTEIVKFLAPGYRVQALGRSKNLHNIKCI